ncbi:MAG: ATP-dependent DNA helicase RecG [Reichenbachiella sp.]
MSVFLDTKIEFLKGVGPTKAQLLQAELGIFTFRDLLQHYPFRYENRSQFHKVSDLYHLEGNAQIKGVVTSLGIKGESRKQRLSVTFKDDTGTIELLWFKGVTWQAKKIKVGASYVIYGRPSQFQNSFSISHPEIEILTPASEMKSDVFVPVYHATEKLKKRFIDNKAIGKLTKAILDDSKFTVNETLDQYIVSTHNLLSNHDAIKGIHFPSTKEHLDQSIYRQKFDELFFIQLRMFHEKTIQKDKHQGIRFSKSQLVNEFYENHLPFDLTGAQKRVIKEIYTDLQSGYQMNRLLQGDVGSGKTITSFICMLIAISNGYQTAIMAPTEILANQHAIGLEEYCDKIGVSIALITGSTSKAKRRKILERLVNGELDIIVGTHALLEDSVQFKKLGFVVIDEQHRFGVAQRAKLWQKNKERFPHILVMTATPIPRTLAMTLYGDLELSTIDELPAGRKPIQTTHLSDQGRLKLFGFIRRQVDEGRQTYIVYPLIEESETLSYKDLMDGYESIRRAFPKDPISILHGKMKSADKDYEMNRFVKGETKIMVATTVIEVGVNVPNASVMVIENSERFGLSQLHQLRGRVGRGAEQSYCILMTGDKVSKEGRARIKCMVETNDGFIIAEKDLEIRGPGDLMGTQQSGVLDLKIADLATDGELLKLARQTAREVIEEDPQLLKPTNQLINKQFTSNMKHLNWGNIS